MQLGWISQYPHEAECLFAPLTGLEVQSTRIDGAVLVIEARLSINLNALTIEQACRGGVRRCYGRGSDQISSARQVVGKRKKLLEDMAAAMEMEIQPKLKMFGNEEVQSGLKYLKEQLEANALQHEGEWYNEDANFQIAVQQTMAAKQSVLADAERLSLLAESIDLSGWSLDDPVHRTRFTSWLQSEAVATTVM